MGEQRSPQLASQSDYEPGKGAWGWEEKGARPKECCSEFSEEAEDVCPENQPSLLKDVLWRNSCTFKECSGPQNRKISQAMITHSFNPSTQKARGRWISVS